MVDVGNLDAVQEIAVLRRSSASHNQVIAIADGREGHPRKRTHDAGDVAVGPRYLLDVLKPDDEEAHGAFGGASQGRGCDGHLVQHLLVLLQLHFDEGCSGRHHVLGCEPRQIADARHHEPMDARLGIREGEPSDGVRGRARLGVPLDVDIGIRNPLSGHPVDYLPAYGECLCCDHATSAGQDAEEQE